MIDVSFADNPYGTFRLFFFIFYLFFFIVSFFFSKSVLPLTIKL